MPKIKSASRFLNNEWETPIPIGVDDANIDITTATTDPTDTTKTLVGLTDSNVTVTSGDTGAAAWTKFNRFRKRVSNALGPLVGKSVINTYEQSGTNDKIYSATFINTQLANKAPLATGVRKNLLDNWYFVGNGSQLPINQRGKSTYTEADYTINRWKLFQTGQVQVTSAGLKLATNAKGFMLLQPIDNVNALLSKQVTTSAIIGGTLVEKLITMPSALPSSGTSVGGSISTAVNGIQTCLRVSEDGLLCFTFYGSSSYTEGDSVTITAVKLELGTEQTLAHKVGSTWVLNEIPDYKEELFKCKTSFADSSDSYANKYISYNVSNKNLLDNWYFVYGKTIDNSHPYSADNSFPINQRGLSTHSGAGYGIDRWFISTQGNVTLSTNGISISNATGPQFRQKIENPERLAGKTVTISMLGNSDYAAIELRNNSGVIKNKLLDSTGFASITCVIDDPTDLYCSIYTRSTNANIIKAVKLELGAEQTLAHLENGVWVLNEIPDYYEELEKCKYYYQRFSKNGMSLGYGSMQTARRASIPVIFPSMMKTPYSFASSGNAGVTYSGGGNPIPTVSLKEGNLSYNPAMAELYADLPTSVPEGNVGECVNLWLRSGAYFEFKAEP